MFVCALQWRECVDDGRRVFKGHSPRSSRDRPFYPSVSSQLLLSENDVSALSTQHFVILPIRTRQRFDTGNVQALVLYTSHSSCLPSLLLIGECRLVESRCFDLSDILFAPRRAWLCALVRACVRAFARRVIPLFIFSVLDSRTQWSCDNVTGDNVAGGQRAKGSQIMRVILIHVIFLKLIYLKTRAISRDISDWHDFILDSYVPHKMLYYGKKKICKSQKRCNNHPINKCLFRTASQPEMKNVRSWYTVSLVIKVVICVVSVL